MSQCHCGQHAPEENHPQQPGDSQLETLMKGDDGQWWHFVAPCSGFEFYRPNCFVQVGYDAGRLVEGDAPVLYCMDGSWIVGKRANIVTQKNTL